MATFTEDGELIGKGYEVPDMQRNLGHIVPRGAFLEINIKPGLLGA